VALGIEDVDVADPPRLEADFRSFVDMLDVRVLRARRHVTPRRQVDLSPRPQMDTDPADADDDGVRTLLPRREAVSGIAFRQVAPGLRTSLPWRAPLRYFGGWNRLPDFGQPPLAQGETSDSTWRQRTTAKGSSTRYVRMPKTVYVFYAESDDGSA
jgi:hypothetical protein